MTPSRHSEIHDTRIDYIEFPATDFAATRAFYTAAFGWTFTEYGPDYLAFSGAGVEGGFDLASDIARQTEPDAPRTTCGVLVVLYTEALEPVLARIRALEVPITREIFAFPGGRRFQFLDPNGNELGVWSDR